MFKFLKKKEGCRLAYFNIAFYAAVMGFGGLSLATHKLEQVYNVYYNISYYLLIFTFIFFVLVSIFYLLKIFINFSDVKSDFIHPVKSNFFPGIGKIFLIFSIGFFSINHDLSTYFFIIGVIIQSIFTIIIFRRWILHPMDLTTMNPLWFLPIVGNMLAPVAGIPLGFIELSWFFYSIGIIMWFLLFGVILNRIIFHNPMPQKLMPTLFILIAPPSVGFISNTILNNGIITDFGKMLYYFSLFMFVIIISKINILSKIKFFMSWWAYSFPMAIFTTATLLFYSKTGFEFIYYLGIVFYIILLIIVGILIYKTLIGARNKELCIEE